MKKRLVSFCLAMLMVVSLLPTVFAADNVSITVGNVTAKAGDTATVDVNISGASNVAFAALYLEFSFGELELTNVALSSAAATAGFSFGENNLSAGIVQIEGDTRNGTSVADGTLMTLTFDVDENANGVYHIEVNYIDDDPESVYDRNNEDVPCVFTAGSITITDESDDSGESTTEGYTANISTTATGGAVAKGDAVEIKVKVNSVFNSAELELAYDTAYLTYVSGATASNDAQQPDFEADADNGTVTIRDYGEAIDAGDGVYTLTFTAIKGGTANVELTSAAFSTAELAETKDLTPATGLNAVAVVINYSVTVNGSTVESATPAEDYVYEIPNYDEDLYEYDVTVKVDGEEVDFEFVDGNIYVGNLTGDLEITYTPKTKNYNVTWAGNAANEVTGVNGLTDGKATHGTAITFNAPTNLDPDGTNDGYKYIVTVTDDSGKTIETSNSTTDDVVTYTISGSDIKADITITITKEEVAADKVTVTVTGSAGLTMQDSEGNALESPATVAKGSSVTLVLSPETGYIYEVKVNGTAVTLDNDQYTITDIQKSITVEVTKTLDTTSVKVQQYLTLNNTNMWLVTINGNGNEQISGKTYSYGGDNMYWSSEYKAYCYLVVASTLTDNDAKAAIGGELVATAATAIDYGMDVNKSRIKDVNDAQLVWNMYSVQYDGITDDVTMEKYLRADVNGDKTVNTEDAAMIITAIKNA